jgi:signal transduction histidine kinase
VPDQRPVDDAADIATLKQALAERTRELHEAREELARSRKKTELGQLVSSMAHELRSPLGAMLTSLHLVESRVAPADTAAKNGLARIRRSVRRCDQIITNLLDYTRYEPLALEETKIDRWLQALFRGQAMPDGVSLTFKPGLGNECVSIDREKLQRAVAHVVDNAAQAALFAGKPGKVSVSTAKNGSCFEIRVTDNGPGIPEEYQSRIFEPFFSGRKAGIGLGLPIAKTVVEQHGGTITFASKPGVQTLFVISVPL